MAWRKNMPQVSALDLARTTGIIKWCFRCFPESMQKCWDKPSIRSRPLPFRPFLLHQPSHRPTLYNHSTERAARHTTRCTLTWSWEHGVVQAVSRLLPTMAAQSRPRVVMWDLWWKKRYLGGFPQSTSVSPANFHSTDCSTPNIIYHLGVW
jgi:hypothetical protein